MKEKGRGHVILIESATPLSNYCHNIFGVNNLNTNRTCTSYAIIEFSILVVFVGEIFSRATLRGRLASGYKALV